MNQTDVEEHYCEPEDRYRCDICIQRLVVAAEVLYDGYKESGIDPFKK